MLRKVAPFFCHAHVWVLSSNWISLPFSSSHEGNCSITRLYIFGMLFYIPVCTCTSAVPANNLVRALITNQAKDPNSKTNHNITFKNSSWPIKRPANPAHNKEGQVGAVPKWKLCHINFSIHSQNGAANSLGSKRSSEPIDYSFEARKKAIHAHGWAQLHEQPRGKVLNVLI